MSFFGLRRSLHHDIKSMNILVCSLSDRPALTNITWTQIQKYCQKHKYAFVTRSHTLDVTRHPSWSKIRLIHELMVCDKYDIIVWIDDDILITEMDMPLDQLLWRFVQSSKTIAVQEDTHGEPFNAGIMVIKNNNTAHKLLQMTYDACNSFNMFFQLWEQTSMKELYFKNTIFQENLYVYPRCTLQGFTNPSFYTHDYLWRNGVFSAHACGVPLEERLAAFHAILSEKNSALE